MRTILLSALLLCATLLASCGRGGSDAGQRPVVVLYSSVDGYVLDEAVRAFEAESGYRVELIGDTEATKTFGLVNRLLSEREYPRADVWWSSEPFGTVRLSEAGVLEPFTIDAAEGAFADGWPASLRGQNDDWYGFAQRSRVIAYHDEAVGEAEAPRTLADLLDGRWRGRVGLARPEFGTTRGHFAALYDAWGEDLFRIWLTALRNNGARIYDGNATVVRAIRDREIDVGLTDTDDVWAGQRQGWPVSFVYETTDDTVYPPSIGPLVLPNTASLVRNGPNPEAGRALLAWIVSPANERLLAESDSRNIPVFPDLAPEYEELLVPQPAEVEFEAVSEAMEDAMAVVEEVFGP